MSDSLSFVLFTIVPAIQLVVFGVLVYRGFALRGERAERTARAKASFIPDGLVYLDPIALYAGTAAGGVFGTILLVFRDSLELWPRIGFEIFFLAGLLLIIAYCSDMLVYDESGFEKRTLLGKKTKYSYDLITAARCCDTYVVVVCGKNKIKLDRLMIGRSAFFLYACKQHKRIMKRGIPLWKPSGFSPLAGVETPWLFFIVYSFLFVLSVLVFIILPITVLVPADGITPPDAQTISTSFSSYERTKADGGTFRFFASGYDKPFCLMWLSGFEVPVPDPEELCGTDVFTVVCHETAKYYSIYSFSSSDGAEMVSVLDSQKAYKNDQRFACILLIIAGVICSVFFAFAFPVRRRPERYPVWFRRWYYKDRVLSWTALEKMEMLPPKRRKR
ncbi:MAG: hypothetical protein IJV00_01815 [Clostridia bacterium]|nr:hypothetical protein [Clostridia bacterium]